MKMPHTVITKTELKSSSLLASFLNASRCHVDYWEREGLKGLTKQWTLRTTIPIFQVRCGYMCINGVNVVWANQLFSG